MIVNTSRFVAPSFEEAIAAREVILKLVALAKQNEHHWVAFVIMVGTVLRRTSRRQLCEEFGYCEASVRRWLHEFLRRPEVQKLAADWFDGGDLQVHELGEVALGKRRRKRKVSTTGREPVLVQR